MQDILAYRIEVFFQACQARIAKEFSLLHRYRARVCVCVCLCVCVSERERERQLEDV